MFSWLRSAITNPHTGGQSAKSVALLFTLVVLTLLAVAVLAFDLLHIVLSDTTVTVLSNVVAAMAAVAGGSYTVGKVSGAISAWRRPPPDGDDNLGDA